MFLHWVKASSSLIVTKSSIEATSRFKGMFTKGELCKLFSLTLNTIRGYLLMGVWKYKLYIILYDFIDNSNPQTPFSPS